MILTLADNLHTALTKVQRERDLRTSEIVDSEQDLLREERLVAPECPSDTCICQSMLMLYQNLPIGHEGGKKYSPVFMSRDVDRAYKRNTEVPLQLRVHEGCYKATTSSVDVDVDVKA